MVLPLTGRGASDVRTPALIRDYFTGQGAFAEDPPEELAERRAEGAYVAQVHQRIKRYIRESAPKYQWPRRHSFHARINDLLMLGLLVETGRREEPQQRGAGRLGSAMGFSERVWVRLAPDVVGRPEWADPLGYLILLKQSQDPSSYQNIRKPGRLLATVVQLGFQPAQQVVQVPRPVVPRPVPGVTVPAAPEAAESVRQLEEERQTLHEAAETLSMTGISANAFERLGRDARGFNATVTRAYGQTPFPDLADALEVLQNCNAALRAEQQLTRQRERALNNCRAGARLVAEAISRPLGAPVPRPSPPPAPPGEIDIVRQEFDRLVEGRPNVASGRRALDRLEAQGVDVAEARDALNEYQAMTRRSDRQSAWENFLKVLENTEPPAPPRPAEATPDQKALRQAWLQTPAGKRFSELRELGGYGRRPVENVEYDRLYQRYLESDMTPAERVRWRREMREAAAMDLAAERETQAAEAAAEAEEEE